MSRDTDQILSPKLADGTSKKPSNIRKPMEKPSPPAPLHMDPTRYGDWEKAGQCIDF